jgi:CheY-like chemotaxis protein
MAHEEGKILLVEDQHEWRMELQRLLLKNPAPFTYLIKTAETLQKASDLLKHHTYDLVLLDLRLKDWEEGNFDGWELMDILAKSKDDACTQTIIVSAYGEPEHVREGFKKYHIFDYIDKKRLDENDFRKSVADAVAKAYEERGYILDKE